MQHDLSLDDLAEESALSHPTAIYNPVGGHKAGTALLDDLRKQLRALASSLNWPEPLSGRTREFDHAFMELLYSKMRIVPGDAGHAGVWSFLSLVLVPELPPWRFPNRTEERVLGDSRNAFRRLWWRAHILGDQPEDVSYRLTEDQLVQIMERPTIGGSRTVARTFSLSFETVSAEWPEISTELLMREGAKRLIRFTPFIDIYGLKDRDLEELTEELFLKAASAIQSSKDQVGRR